MKATTSRKGKQDRNQQPEWPKLVQPGRAIVRVYQHKTPAGNFTYQVARYDADGKRHWDSYVNPPDALAAAETLAKRIDSRDYVAASMTRDQAIEYANSVARLKPYGVTVDAATAAVAEWLAQVGDLSNVHAAIKFYRARFKQTIKKPVAEVVAELLKVKAARGASDRYKADLKGRLERFAGDCNKDACNVTASDIQAWLDSQKTEKGKALSPQTYKNNRTVLHTLFEFAVARGFAADNPVASVEKLKVRNGDVEIFTPIEIARLLEAARAEYPAFLPCLAIGAFAGLRSAEIERLEWSDIDLTARHIIVAASKSKTASRRIVPIADNLAEWLRPYSGRQGKVWTGNHFEFYDVQQELAAATAVEADEKKGIKAQKPVTWKQNGLRHSFASYRFAQSGDAGRVAGECGNSASVIHRHYRELVKPADAERWFAVKPEAPANVLPLAATAISAGA
jgi:integrase